MTNGHKSSERKAVYHAFFVNALLIGFAIYKGSDLGGIAGALGAMNTLVMAYVFGRSYVKGKNGDGTQNQ
jgi:hypothetical protein